MARGWPWSDVVRLQSLVPLLAVLASPFSLITSVSAAEVPIAPPATPTLVDEHADDQALVVTADRRETVKDRTFASIDVVGQEEVRERGYQPFIHDWLRGLPGVDVNQTGGGFAGTTQVRLRGAKSGETRFLRDGIPVTDASAIDNGPLIELFDPLGLERVEVVRGSQSGLYGSGANGGVVNLISARPTSAHRMGVRLEGGSHATLAGGAQASGPLVGGLGYVVGIGGLVSDGFSTATDADANGDPRDHEADGIERLGANLRLQHTGKHGLLYLSSNVVEATQDFDGFPPPTFTLAPDDRDSTQELDSWRIAGGGEWRPRQQVTIASDVAYTASERRYPQETTYTKEFLADDLFANVRAHAGLPGDFSADLGVDGLWQQAELIDAAGSASIDESARLIGVWLTLAYDLPWLALSATGRHDDHSREGDADTWRVGAATFWFEQQYKVFASAGSGFRAPSLYELYDPFYGNPDLEPQTSLSADLGHTIRPAGSGWSLTNTGFLTRYKDAITFDPNTFVSINLPSDARIHGIENALAWNGTHGGIAATYTWQDSDDGDGASLPQLPDHKLMIAGTGRVFDGWLRLYAERQWSRLSGGQDLPPYTVVGASAGWAISRNWEIYGRADNLLDEDYEIQPSYATPRRAAYGGVRATF